MNTEIGRTLLTVSNQAQSHVNEALYLGVMFSVDRSMGGELDGTFEALKRNAFGNRELSRKAKGEVYNVMPVPMMMYRCKL